MAAAVQPCCQACTEEAQHLATSTGSLTTTVHSATMQRYNVLKPLGDGAFGEVWLAVDKQTGEKVAIKRIKKR